MQMMPGFNRDPGSHDTDSSEAWRPSQLSQHYSVGTDTSTDALACNKSKSNIHWYVSEDLLRLKGSRRMNPTCVKIPSVEVFLEI